MAALVLAALLWVLICEEQMENPPLIRPRPRALSQRTIALSQAHPPLHLSRLNRLGAPACQDNSCC